MTFTPVVVTLNGFVFDGITPDLNGVLWDWQSLDGWFDTTAITVTQQPFAMGGSTVTIARQEARPLTLTALAHMPSTAPMGDLVYASMRRLKAAVNALYGPVTLEVQEPGLTLVSGVRLTGPILSTFNTIPSSASRASVITGTRREVQFLIPLVAPDPRRYQITPTTIAAYTGSATITNFGDIATPPVFTVSAGAVNPTITNNSLSGATLQWTGTVPGGQTLVIDVGAETVLLNGVNARSGLTTAQWFQLAPGANLVVMSDATQVVYQDAYS